MSNDSEHFRIFARQLEQAIAKYGDMSEVEFTALQKRQVEGLQQLEEDFRLALVRHRHCQRVYEAFVRLIRDERKNILAARPYFRARKDVFTSQIAPALDKRSWRRLLGCHVNYQFVAFAMKAAHWKPGSPVSKLARKIAAARTALIEMNLPLAISRARIFQAVTPKSHLSFMDLVDLAAEGLASAVDKYEGPYREVFRSVMIGWCVGNFIECYSQTMLHFYPKDKRRIYRALKYIAKHPHGDVDPEELAKFVNRRTKKAKAGEPELPAQLPEHQRASVSEIQDLVSAASTVSADTKAPGEEEDVPDNVARYEAPEESRPDVLVEKSEALRTMCEAAKTLPLVDRKLMSLKGIDITA